MNDNHGTNCFLYFGDYIRDKFIRNEFELDVNKTNMQYTQETQ